jgi:hypothetical protein
MMFGDNLTASDPTYYMYMPISKTWEIIDPIREIVEVRFPGFLILKHKNLEDSSCKGLERLKRVLSLTIRSVVYNSK